MCSRPRATPPKAMSPRSPGMALLESQMTAISPSLGGRSWERTSWALEAGEGPVLIGAAGNGVRCPTEGDAERTQGRVTYERSILNTSRTYTHAVADRHGCGLDSHLVGSPTGLQGRFQPAAYRPGDCDRKCRCAPWSKMWSVFGSGAAA